MHRPLARSPRRCLFESPRTARAGRERARSQRAPQFAVLRAEAQAYLFTGLDRFVERIDELEASPPFEAVDERSLAVLNAVDDVLQVHLMAEAVHVRRVHRILLTHLVVARLGFHE